MNLKTFTARTMGEALAQVRRHVGADAVILHTRTYQRGGFLGLGARSVVEITAVDGQEYARRRGGAQRGRPTPRRAPRRAPASDRGSIDRSRDVGDPATPEYATGAAGDLIRRTYAAARAEMERNARAAASPASSGRDIDTGTGAPAPAHAGATAVATSGTTSSSSAVPVAPAAPVEASEPDQLAEEMRSMKRMVARMMTQQQRQRDESDLPEKLFDQYLALLEQEVAEELAGEIIQQVRHEIDPARLEDEHACRRAVMNAVAKLLPIDRTAQDTGSGAGPSEGSGVGASGGATGGDRPRTIALVGPTGVGKTTTIAKLAATFKLKRNQRVGLITMDTYRIAAVDQLKTYASIIGVPLHVVAAPHEMADAVRRCQGCDVVLIDTAGRSQRDDPRLAELQTFLEAANPHETHLVLSSTCTQRVLEDTIERFAKIHTDRIIFTKLDEAVTLGVVLNVLRKVEKRLSYITTGQEVPHQIEPGRPDRLAALLLGEHAVTGS